MRYRGVACYTEPRRDSGLPSVHALAVLPHLCMSVSASLGLWKFMTTSTFLKSTPLAATSVLTNTAYLLPVNLQQHKQQQQLIHRQQLQHMPHKRYQSCHSDGCFGYSDSNHSSGNKNRRSGNSGRAYLSSLVSRCFCCRFECRP